jgi:hypothetical protein
MKWLMLFKEIIAVYSDNQMKHMNKKNAGSLIVKAGGIYSNHLALKG